MKLLLTENKQYVLAKPENKIDRAALERFPGFHRDRGSEVWYCEAFSPILYNLYVRLKAIYKRPIGLSREVKALIEGTFKLKEIPSTFKFYTNPLRHQEIALRFFYTMQGGGLLLDPGLGKTKVVLDGIALCKFKKSLIICPKALLFVWEDEIVKHRPDLKPYVVESTTWGIQIKNLEKKVFDREKTIERIKREKSFINGKYGIEERLSILEERFERDRSNAISKLQDGWERDKGNIEAADVVIVNYDKVVTGQYYFEKLGFDFVAVDEGLIKDPKTERTKAVTRLGYRIPNRCIMSGTLVNNSILDVFAPVRFIQPSLTGTAFGKFRERYCHLVYPDKKRNPHKSFITGFKDEEEVRSILETCSIVMRKEEWLELPDKNFHYIYSPMSSEQEFHYENMLANYITKLEDGTFVEADSPLTVLCKLSQISNGFLYSYDDSEVVADLGIDTESVKEDSSPSVKRKVSDRTTTFFSQQSKIESFKELFQKELSTRKFIMWYNMSAELELIEGCLKKEGLSYSVIKGGDKNVGEKVRQFNTDPSLQILVCQARAVNYGITVLGTSMDDLEDSDFEAMPDIDPMVYTHVFYSLNYSLELLLQQQDRSHRIGQTRNVDYFFLLSDNDFEREIISKLNNKMSIRDTILVDVFNKLKNT